MKIISTEVHNRHIGTIGAASDISGDFLLWNPVRFSVFDLIDSIKPDVIFIDLRYITKNIISVLSANPGIKVVLFGQGIPSGLKPSVVVAQPNTSKILRKNIESEEYETLYLHDSANIFEIFGQEKKDELSCEIGYVFSNNNPETYVEQILTLGEVSNKFKTKIVGERTISVPNYLGSMSKRGLSSFYRSADIMLDFDGANLLDIAANGGFALSFVENHLYPVFKDTSSIESFLEKSKTRKRISKKAQEAILKSDTCYHRLISIFEAIGKDVEELTEITKQKLKEKISCVLE